MRPAELGSGVTTVWVTSVKVRLPWLTIMFANLTTAKGTSDVACHALGGIDDGEVDILAERNESVWGRCVYPSIGVGGDV